MAEAWRALDFESGIFARPVWRLDEPDAAGACVEAARKAGVFLIACRLAAHAPAGALIAAGFRPIETLVTLARPLDPAEAGGAPGSVRLAAGPGDARACAEIAARAFRHDRFHADPDVDDKAADRLKADWAANAVAGRADRVFLALDETGRAVGFNACLWRGAAPAIDLIAVDPAAAGKGHGRRLVAAAIAAYAGRAERLLVGTQADNAPSLRLYRAAGFREIARATSYHWRDARAVRA